MVATIVGNADGATLGRRSDGVDVSIGAVEGAKGVLTVESENGADVF